MKSDNMRILYYDWNEFNGSDCRDAFERLGHCVESFTLNMQSYDLRPEYEAKIGKLVKKTTENGDRYYDLLFSFDFFPNISLACQKFGMPYVSWVFDCPHYTLDSRVVNNPVNRIYVFDKLLYSHLKNKGVTTINYSPLGVNDKRLSELCNRLDLETNGNIVYEHEVCFLGNLYDNEYNFYDQVNSFPSELKGYIDAVIKSQEYLFGVDFFSNENIISKDKIKEIRKILTFEDTGKYEIDYDNVVLDILRKKVTVNERYNILKRMGKYFDTVMYTMPDARSIEGVCNLGIASYYEKMPRVFHRSKINLNITLRSILSGVPLRVMDILAAGGFLITTYQEEIAEYFTDGEDLVIAYTPEEMLKKVAYYLEKEEERKIIARNGQKKVFEKFSYTNLLPSILGQ